MVKIINEIKLDKTLLRDLAANLSILEDEARELKVPLGDLASPGTYGKRQNLDYRKEGFIGVLERDLVNFKLTLNKVRGAIKPTIKNLKKSLQ